MYILNTYICIYIERERNKERVSERKREKERERERENEREGAKERQRVCECCTMLMSLTTQTFDVAACLQCVAAN